MHAAINGNGSTVGDNRNLISVKLISERSDDGTLLLDANNFTAKFDRTYRAVLKLGAVICRGFILKMHWCIRIRFPLKVIYGQLRRYAQSNKYIFRNQIQQNVQQVTARFVHNSKLYEEAEILDYDHIKFNSTDQQSLVRDNLYVGSSNPVVVQLKQAKSIQEVQ